MPFNTKHRRWDELRDEPRRDPDDKFLKLGGMSERESEATWECSISVSGPILGTATISVITMARSRDG